MEWVQRWVEDKPGDLVGEIPSIIKSPIAEAPMLAAKVETQRVRNKQERHKLEMEEWRLKDEEKAPAQGDTGQPRSTRIGYSDLDKT